MSIPNIINTIGVTLILLAFFLLTVKVLKQDDLSYNLLNLFGGGLACYGSYLIDAPPFVVLEGVWAIVALYAIIKNKNQK